MKRYLCTTLTWMLLASLTWADDTSFRAGAATIDISPRVLPAIRNGGFLQAMSDRVDDPLHARCLVLSDGSEQIAIAIVDSCMFSTDICDLIKTRVTKQIGIPGNRILVSATHTHSAPSVMAFCLGSGRDEPYTEFVVPRVAQAIVAAHSNLQPAKIGWASIDSSENTNCRRWITRSDRMGSDPFGLRTVRAMMHPGYQNPDYVCPSGPVDPEISVVSVVAAKGDQPLCVMANYSMHYYGGTPGFSADYFGQVAGELEAQLGNQNGSDSPFVGIMSQGTSGDLHWMNYSKPPREITRSEYSKQIATSILAARKQIQHRGDVTLEMAESRLKLKRRVPSPLRLAWSKPINAARGDLPPRNRQEVYAQQAEWIDTNRETELVLQAIRIGDLAITALPNEVYAITGLKLKQQSPLESTFNLELANGAEGYIPPPEQHRLGGYTTWPARTAGLEEQAEPRIVDAVLSLLENVSGKSRKPHVDPPNDYFRGILDAKPKAYWRLGDIASDRVEDSIGDHHATYDGGVALYLTGPDFGGPDFAGPDFAGRASDASGDAVNRCVYFAGGRVVADVLNIENQYSVEMWVRNELPIDARPVTGYFFTRGVDGAKDAAGDCLGIGGTHANAGRLFVFNGNQRNESIAGTTELARGKWQHVAMTRENNRVRVFLNGKLEIDQDLSITYPAGCSQFQIGGRNDSFANFDGMIDETTLYDRVLTQDEIQSHFQRVGTDDPNQRDHPQPTRPEDSVNQIHVPPGYEVELVAAEPLVKDPVAIDWGHDGKLWVVEMADYPLGIDGNGKPGGRIRYVEDTDHDGHYETSTLFADGLSFPTGVLVWGRGVLVTAAPEILYFEDTTGDGIADLRKPLFTGFLEGNQQLRVNGLRLGLDGWVYCASGSHHSGYGKASQIKSELTGRRVAIGSRDFRIRPDTGQIQPLSGPSQFGRNRDDWGNWFGVQNSRPLWHYVLADQDIKRNPHFAPPDPKHQVITPVNPKVYPAAKLQKRFHSFEQAGRFTSACSAMIYRDELLFSRANDEQHAFTCEPFHNLVQHNIITDQGVSFGFHRDPAETEFDFFASRDRWCRPVMVRTGPEGALWVVDMYRYMIEHPEWLPENGKQELRPYFRLGEDQGRIYRVVPAGSNPRLPNDRWLDLSTTECVAQLESQNGWQRDAAQRRIVRSADPAAQPLLNQMLLDSRNPRARLHALCTLAELDALTTEALETACRDESAGVRRCAVRLCEGCNGNLQTLVQLVDDPDDKVRLQLAVTLGSLTLGSLTQESSDDSPAVAALASLAIRSADEPYIIANVISSLHRRNITGVISEYCHQLGSIETVSSDQRALQSLLFQQAAAIADVKAFGEILELICKPAGQAVVPWQQTSLAQFLDGLEAREFSLSQLSTAHNEWIDRAIDDARRSNPSESAMALMLRQPQHYESDLQRIVDLLGPQFAIEIQLAAVNRLSEMPDPQVATKLLARWSSFSPQLRSLLLNLFASRSEWSRILVAAVQQGTVTTAEFNPAMQQRYLATSDTSLQADWRQQFANLASTDRKAVIAEYQSALKLEGDAKRGETLFTKSCATCHKMGSVGQDIGPNLASITDKRPEALLSAILDPSVAVEARYLQYKVLTNQGRVLNGLLATETASSITLIDAQGKQETILRQQIDRLRASDKSLMPEGLEKDLHPQDIADLIAYLRTE